MRLIECYIENFGKLSSFSHTFDQGINCFCENNSWGKSTLAAFIKAMFYGLPVTRASDLLKNERKKYYPWNGGTFGGTLTFERGGRAYRIERIFTKNGKDEHLRVIDLASGKECEDFGTSIGYSIFGINSEAFVKSAFISRNTPSDSKDEGLKSITAKLNGIIDSTDIENYNEAIKAIDNRRKYYAVTRGGAIGESERTIEQLCLSLAERRQRESELAQKRAELDLLMLTEDSLRKEHRELSERFKAMTRYNELLSKHREFENLERTYIKLKNEREELDAFFAKGTPTPKEISDCERALGQFELLEKDISLASEDPFCIKARQEELYFASYLPEEDELTKLSDKYEELCEELEDIPRLTDEEERELHDLEIMSFPSDDELETHKARRARITVLEHSKQFFTESASKSALPSENKKKSNAALVTLLIGALICIFLGVGLCFVWLPVGAVAGVLGILLLAAFIFLYFKNYINSRLESASPAAATFDKQIEKQNAELEVLIAQSKAFEKKYGIDPEKGDAVEILSERIRRIGTLTEKVNRIEQASELARLHEESVSAALHTMFLRIGHPELASEDIHALSERYSAYLQIKERSDELIENAEHAKAHLEHLKALTESFFSRFPETGVERSESLYLIRTSAERYESLAKSYRAAEQARESFVKENPGCETLPALPDASLPEGDIEELMEDKLKELQQLEKSKGALLMSIAKLTELIDSSLGIEEELETEERTLEHLKHRLAVIEKTKELLAKAKDDLSGRYLGRMREKFDEYITVLAESELLESELDRDFVITLKGGGIMRESEYFSTGICDLVDLALSLALVDALFESERTFIILDDPFANLDPDKLGRAKGILARLSENTQIIYFTCHESRVL